jgi:hypothetical protein
VAEVENRIIPPGRLLGSERPGFFSDRKIFPGDDEFSYPLPPYLMSDNLSLEAESVAAPFNV